jgi:hypothetical protein
MPENITGTEGFTNGPVLKPSDKDQGPNEVFAILETFMERIATHSHTGADSKEISVNFSKSTQDLAETVDYTWNAQGDHIYRATITIAAPGTEDNLRSYFYKSPTEVDWVEFQPDVERVDATSYYLFTNDNSIDEIRVVYY